MDLEIIRYLREISSPVIDWIFYNIITQIGDQYFFIIVAAIIYWTINKKYAHKFVLTFMVSALVNTGIKAIVQRPRPYTDPSIIPPFDYYTTGYSFPSGHAQAAGVLGYTAYDGAKKTGKKWLLYVGIAIMVLVPFSRMLLAQHYLTDVLAGLVISVAIAFGMFKLVDLMNDKEEYYTFLFIPIMVVLMILLPAEKDIFVASGAFLGFAVGYFLEKHYVKYDVKNKVFFQILKVLLGLAVALGLKEGIKLILPDTNIFHFIRYFLVGGWVTVGAPLVFKYVFKNRKKNI